MIGACGANDGQGCLIALRLSSEPLKLGGLIHPPLPEDGARFGEALAMGTHTTASGLSVGLLLVGSPGERRKRGIVHVFAFALDDEGDGECHGSLPAPPPAAALPTGARSTHVSRSRP